MSALAMIVRCAAVQCGPSLYACTSCGQPTYWTRSHGQPQCATCALQVEAGLLAPIPDEEVTSCP